MENMTQEASQMLNEVMLLLVKSGMRLRWEWELLSQTSLLFLVIGWLPGNLSTNEDCIDLESGLKTEEVFCKFCWFEKCPKCDGYGRPANNRIERIMKELKDNDTALKFIPAEMVKELKENGYALKFIPVEAVKVLKEDEYALFIADETAKKLNDAMIEEVVNKSLGKRFAEWVGYANDYIEKIVKPEMGLLFSGAVMQNIYQLDSSGMVNTGKGKTLLKLNEAAFMMLLYGLVMPRRAAGHIALAIGVALASAAYLDIMGSAF